MEPATGHARRITLFGVFDLYQILMSKIIQVAPE
jgi:hypothetical protein